MEVALRAYSCRFLLAPSAQYVLRYALEGNVDWRPSHSLVLALKPDEEGLFGKRGIAVQWSGACYDILQSAIPIANRSGS